VAGCTGWQVAGAVFEVVGFTAAACELYRVRRETLGVPAPWERVRPLLRELLHGSRGEPLPPLPLRLTGTFSMSRPIEPPPTFETLEDRVDWHDKLIAQLAKNVQQARETAATDDATIRGEINALRENLRERDIARDQRQKRFTSTSVRWQLYATFSFFVGVGFSLFGNLHTC
jgi:hypothetical protein